MPRRDLSAERTEQILSAFERCVVAHGLAGATLERVAELAGVKRSILRHYVGNREDLVHAMAARFFARYDAQLRLMATYCATGPRIDNLLHCLLPRQPGEFSDVVLAEALIAAAENDDGIREQVATMMTNTVETVRTVLRAEYPEADARQAWEVAYGVVGISFNHESLSPIALPKRFRSAAVSASRRLIESLARTT